MRSAPEADAGQDSDAQPTGRPSAVPLRRRNQVGPADQLAAGKSFFAEQGLDVRHFGAIWHVLKIGQLMATDLNAVSGRHGLSIADFHLLGALMMGAPAPQRATDLAHALNVTNAALSARIRRLERRRLIVCDTLPGDRRSRSLELTPSGREKVRLIAGDLEQHGRFVHHYRQLTPADQQDLDRIVTRLHVALARDFVAAPRQDC